MLLVARCLGEQEGQLGRLLADHRVAGRRGLSRCGSGGRRTRRCRHAARSGVDDDEDVEVVQARCRRGRSRCEGRQGWCEEELFGEVGRVRLGAGSSPASFKIFSTVEAATATVESERLAYSISL